LADTTGMNAVVAHLAEPAAQDSLQAKLLQSASMDPEKFKQFFRRLRETFPEQTAEACLWYVAAHGTDPAARQMARWLASGEKYFEILFDPEYLNLEVAQKATAAMKEMDPLFFRKFFKIASELTSPPHLGRALALFPVLGDYSALISLLRNLSHHSDDRVRSKAVKLLCELRPNKTQIERQMQSEDSRVRSSALEAIWHTKSEETRAIFRAALLDSNHRVVSNALVGLQLKGDPAALDGMIEFSTHQEPLFRAAMAWALGHVRDPRSIATLQTLSRDSTAVVRKRALKSLLLLQNEPEISETRPVTEVQAVAVEAVPVVIPEEKPKAVMAPEVFAGFSSYK
jgi:HEAT repeats